MKHYLPFAAMIALAPIAAFAQSSSPRPAGETNISNTPTTNDPTTGRTEAAMPESNDPMSGATQAPTGTGMSDMSTNSAMPADTTGTSPTRTHGKRPHRTQQ